MLPEHSRNHISEVLQEVEAVGNLHGARSDPTYSLAVLIAKVPAHHLDPRMLRKPSGEGVCATVRQNIHRHVSFKIHQYRPVAGPATEGEVVHAQNPGRLAMRRPHRADVVQHRVSGGHDPEIFQKARARFSAEGEGGVQEPTIEPLGSSPVACGHNGQTDREDYPVAVPFVAEEPSGVQTNGNGDSLPGQISQLPRVSGVDSSASLAAPRATSRTGRGFAKRMMTFASARIPMRSSRLGAGSTVRKSGMGDLDDLRFFSVASLPHLFTES